MAQQIKKTTQSSRQSQQAKAKSFKEEKQKQGKFGGVGGTPSNVKPSTDVQQLPQGQGRTRAEQAILNAPKARPELLAEDLPQSDLIQQKLETPIQQTKPGLFQRAAETIIGKQVEIDEETLPPEEKKKLEQQRLLAQGVKAVDIAAGVGLIGGLAAGLTSTAATAEQIHLAGLAASKLPGAAASAKFSYLWTGTTGRYVLKSGEKLLVPNKIVSFLTKFRNVAGGTKPPVNSKSMGLISKILLASGVGTSMGALILRYVQESSQDIPVSVINSIDSEANVARAQEDFEEANNLELVKQEALQANADLDKQYGGINPINIGKTLYGLRSKAVSKIRFDPVNGTEAKISARRLELNRRMQEHRTPKLFLDSLEEDKKNDFSILDAKTKEIVQGIQAAKAGTEGALYNEFSKMENAAEANNGRMKAILTEEYESLRKDFIKTKLDQQQAFMDNYLAGGRTEKEVDLSQFD